MDLNIGGSLAQDKPGGEFLLLPEGYKGHSVCILYPVRDGRYIQKAPELATLNGAPSEGTRRARAAQAPFP